VARRLAVLVYPSSRSLVRLQAVIGWIGEGVANFKNRAIAVLGPMLERESRKKYWFALPSLPC
jgi:hypothetical protein